MLTKNTLSLTVIGLGSIYSPDSFAQKTAEKNILFICIDDFRAEANDQGTKQAITPQLDRFANKATVFRHHYVQVPTSGASRYSMLTGLNPQNIQEISNEAIAHRITGQPETERPESFIHLLRRNGYHTIGIGKIGHSADGYHYPYGSPKNNTPEMPHSWNQFLFNPGKWKTGWNAFFGYADGYNRNTQKGMVKPYECVDTDDTGYPDGLTAELAVEQIRQLANSKHPFFLGVGFFKPHLPFNAPKKYWDLYEEEQIRLTPYDLIPEHVNRASLHNSHEIKQYKLGEEDATIDHPLSPAYARKLVHAYLACVSYIDEQVGKVLKALEETGLDKNTIVVIWGDHGWHLGEQRMWGKHTIFEAALNSSLMIRTPEHRKGHICDQIVGSTDLYPTIADLCNVKMSHPTDGRSLRPLLEKKDTKQWQDIAYSYFNKGVSVRTSRYRLTHYYRKATPTIELYDYNKDPYETINLAEQHPELVRELMPLLEQGDTGLFKNKP